ncbi:MAG: hypothetical protein DWI22_05980 [Planctomycetota bacterium]|nr:MAG: hypothetical protein DWI22_05980 [Planctomycetota bacterium]
MRSIPQALMWEMFSHGRWHILGFFVLGNLLPLFVYGALSPLDMDPHDSALLTMHLCFLPITLFQFAFGIVAAQGSLSRLYTTPISTASLVAWHMFPGGFLLAIEVAVAAWAYNILFHVGWPIWGPALFAAAAWATGQLLVSVSQRTFSSFCLAGTPCVLIFMWLRSRYGGWFSNATHYWSEVTAVEIATLVGVVGLAYIVTVRAVRRDRCGEPMPSLGGWKWLLRTWDAMTTTSGIGVQPFRSAATAQFWYDWTLKGLALPLLVILIYVVVVSVWLIRIAYGVNEGPLLAEFYAGILAGSGFLTLMAGVTGMMTVISSNEYTTRNRGETIRDLAAGINQAGMGNFQSTLPFTNSDFSQAILQTAFRSILIAWSLWAAGFFGCLLISQLMPHVPMPAFPPELQAWYLPLTLLGPWIAMTNLSLIGLSGRGIRMVFLGVTGLVSYGIGMILIKEVFSAEVQNQVFAISLFLGSITIVGGTLWAFMKAQRREFLTHKAQYASGILWIAIVILGIAIRPKDLPVVAYPMMLAFSALVILPLAATPLAIAWNRHR